MKHTNFKYLGTVDRILAILLLFVLSHAPIARGDHDRFWPVMIPSDSHLNQNHALMPYMRAAALRQLPLRYFRELIEAGAEIQVLEGDWPTYKPSVPSGGTIYMPSASNPLAWTKHEWASFYNELFHAWFGNIATQLSSYQSFIEQIHTAERREHYARALPSNPWIAQEEGWSESVAALILTLTPSNRDGEWNYVGLADCTYKIGRTVAPVSHSERPGYTPEAETTYPAPWEHALLFETLTSVPLPYSQPMSPVH